MGRTKWGCSLWSQHEGEKYNVPNINIQRNSSYTSRVQFFKNKSYVHKHFWRFYPHWPKYKTDLPWRFSVRWKLYVYVGIYVCVLLEQNNVKERQRPEKSNFCCKFYAEVLWKIKLNTCIHYLQSVILYYYVTPLSIFFGSCEEDKSVCVH
jgi:hypothetical protein